MWQPFVIGLRTGDGALLANLYCLDSMGGERGWSQDSHGKISISGGDVQNMGTRKHIDGQANGRGTRHTSCLT